MFYFSSLVTQVTSDLIRVNIYLAPSIATIGKNKQTRGFIITRALIVEKYSQMKYNTVMSIKEKINDNIGATATPYVSDTPAHIQEILIAGYRRMSPQKKLKRVSELTKAVQQLALARIRQQYGKLSEQEQRLRLASLWLDRETMIKVFNWDPSVKGY